MLEIILPLWALFDIFSLTHPTFFFLILLFRIYGIFIPTFFFWDLWRYLTINQFFLSFLYKEMLSCSIMHQLNKLYCTIRNDVRSHLHSNQFILGDGHSSFSWHTEVIFIIIRLFIFAWLEEEDYNSKINLIFLYLSISWEAFIESLKSYFLKELILFRYSTMAERKVLIKYFPKNFDH